MIKSWNVYSKVTTLTYSSLIEIHMHELWTHEFEGHNLGILIGSPKTFAILMQPLWLVTKYTIGLEVVAFLQVWAMVCFMSLVHSCIILGWTCLNHLPSFFVKVYSPWIFTCEFVLVPFYRSQPYSFVESYGVHLGFAFHILQTWESTRFFTFNTNWQTYGYVTICSQKIDKKMAIIKYSWC
jgi:hypothetical protein